jgi:uncharacterized Zn-finger protein
VFKCQQCDSKFSTNGHLKNHIKAVHDKIRDVECPQCDSKFTRNDQLKNHIKAVHDKIRDHECQQCDYKCSTGSDLKKHIKTVHDNIKDVECPQCDSKFPTNVHLKTHIKAVHDKIKDHECQQCDYKCSNSSDLKNHIKAVHDKIKDHECQQCDFKCSNSSVLKNHIKICTGDRIGSAGECKIEDCLIDMKIEHTMRTTYELKNEADNWLEWDCMITYNDKILFIEYDGIQHVIPRRFGGISQDVAFANFTKQIKHDDLKNKYCSDNNYPLLRIPHTQFGNIAQLITEFICKHTTWDGD